MPVSVSTLLVYAENALVSAGGYLINRNAVIYLAPVDGDAGSTRIGFMGGGELVVPYTRAQVEAALATPSDDE